MRIASLCILIASLYIIIELQLASYNYMHYLHLISIIRFMYNCFWMQSD